MTTVSTYFCRNCRSCNIATLFLKGTKTLLSEVIISILAPARGVTVFVNVQYVHAGFQSSPPRGERRCWPAVTALDAAISIHAPARGATGNDRLPQAHVEISIHAPARGATYRMLIMISLRIISIHAPARGATMSNIAVKLTCCANSL